MMSTKTHRFKCRVLKVESLKERDPYWPLVLLPYSPPLPSAGCLRQFSLGDVRKCINIIANIEQYNGHQWRHSGMNAFLVSNINNIQYTVFNTSGTSIVCIVALYMCVWACVCVYI